MDIIRLYTDKVPQLIPIPYIYGTLVSESRVSLDQSSEDGVMGIRQFVTMFIPENPDELVEKVKNGAVFQFKWRDGKYYQLPVEAVRFMTTQVEDELGVVIDMPVAQLQILLNGNISQFEIDEPV